MTLDPQWDDYKARANEVALLSAAQKCGASLKRSGQEHVGPCPACGGKDRFSINPAKGKWNCRGAGGGGQAIGLVMHCLAMDFKAACEFLTGEAPPTGQSGTWDEDAQNRARERRQASEAKQAQEQDEASLQEGQALERAVSIWQAGKLLAGTPAEAYLRARGHMLSQWPDSLRFHPTLKHPEGSNYPALICRVDDSFGDQTGVWRIFIADSAKGWGKAPVSNAKLGLGPCGGGAVRLAEPLDGEVCLAEGIETSLAVTALTGRPCWAALSTSGLVGFEAPFDIASVRIYADADFSKYSDSTGKWSEPAGMKAARQSRDRLVEQGVNVLDIVEPATPGSDWEDVMNLTRTGAAA